MKVLSIEFVVNCTQKHYRLKFRTMAFAEIETLENTHTLLVRHNLFIYFYKYITFVVVKLIKLLLI